MEFTRKELKELGFHVYTWKQSIESQVYSMDEKAQIDFLNKLSRKKIDIVVAIECVQNAVDVIKDRMSAALDDDNNGGYNLLENRLQNFKQLLARLERKAKTPYNEIINSAIDKGIMPNIRT